MLNFEHFSLWVNEKLQFLIGLPQAFHVSKPEWGYAKYDIAIRTSAWGIYDKTKMATVLTFYQNFHIFHVKTEKNEN